MRLVWLSGLWAAPVCWILLVSLHSHAAALAASVAACALAPLPALVLQRRCSRRLEAEARQAQQQTERVQLELETIRFRTSRLRDELEAADRQARLSHQLTLLGQFTAGFLHEFNNPLAILMNRIEVLQEERKDDAGLCADLDQMLKETRYMGNIAGTLLRALRREPGEETFSPCLPAEALQEAVDAFGPTAEKQGVRLALEAGEAPRVNLPAHVLVEVTRTLVANALDALAGRPDAAVWVRLEPYHRAGAKVMLRVEDNGPGVPEELREHLFEPFVSRGTRRDRLGLGLFLAASLLNTYDSVLRYEPRPEGGACFVMELPPARFSRSQPYHWFIKEGA